MEAVDSSQIISIAALTIFFGAFVLAIFVVFNKKKNNGDTKEQDEDKSEINDSNKKETSQVSSNGVKKTQAKDKHKGKAKEAAFTHPMLLTTLKGHTGSLMQMEFSRCGKYLGSCSEDRTIRLWASKEFNEKDHKYIRVNVDLDHATAVSFSPDSRAFIASLSVDNTIRVFKITKKKDANSPAVVLVESEDFPKVHKAEILNVAISSTGKFIMSASKDTTIIIWTLKGEVLATVDTLLVYNTDATVSPCGSLVAASGFASDIKMWHVEFLDKGNGNFKQVTRALELKGHSAAVYSFAFSTDSKKVASISKDGTWKLWDVDVNYQKGQDAYLLYTCSYTNLFPGSPSSDAAKISISPDGFTVAIAIGKSIILIDTQSKEKSEVLHEVHGDTINCLAWSPDSRELASSGFSDRTIRVWHNPIGVNALLKDLKHKLTKVKTDSHKERIEHLIDETKSYLKSITRH